MVLPPDQMQVSVVLCVYTMLLCKKVANEHCYQEDMTGLLCIISLTRQENTLKKLFVFRCRCSNIPTQQWEAGRWLFQVGRAQNLFLITLSSSVDSALLLSQPALFSFHQGFAGAAAPVCTQLITYLLMHFQPCHRRWVKTQWLDESTVLLSCIFLLKAYVHLPFTCVACVHRAALCCYCYGISNSLNLALIPAIFPWRCTLLLSSAVANRQVAFIPRIQDPLMVLGDIPASLSAAPVHPSWGWLGELPLGGHTGSSPLSVNSCASWVMGGD